MPCMRQFYVLALVLVLLCGCSATRVAKTPSGPHVRVLTYNVNWGAPRPDLAIEAIRRADADIVCLQETTPQWEQYLRDYLPEYRFAEGRDSKSRTGGGLAFLAKTPAEEVAYIPSETGWFDGWIMKFHTAIGPIQVLNVHLRPPISDGGSWVSGYFTTRDDREQEMERFHRQREAHTPLLVAGDFNDHEDSRVADWLKKQGLTNALPQFDRYSPTWKWRTSLITVKRRMDHIFYSPELDCTAARVISAGASDHFPVEATFTIAVAQLQR